MILFNIFTKTKKPKDFKWGHVYKMEVAERSEVRKPYYVLIKRVCEDKIVTTIPNGHDLVIEFKDKSTWKYQTERMSHVGGSEFYELLYNQDLY